MNDILSRAQRTLTEDQRDSSFKSTTLDTQSWNVDRLALSHTVSLSLSLSLSALSLSLCLSVSLSLFLSVPLSLSLCPWDSEQSGLGGEGGEAEEVTGGRGGEIYGLVRD